MVCSEGTAESRERFFFSLLSFNKLPAFSSSFFLSFFFLFSPLPPSPQYREHIYSTLKLNICRLAGIIQGKVVIEREIIVDKINPWPRAGSQRKSTSFSK